MLWDVAHNGLWNLILSTDATCPIHARSSFSVTSSTVCMTIWRQFLPWRDGPTQMKSSHRGLVKTDLNKACWIKCQNSIFHYIFINLDDSRGSTRWRIHSNWTRSAHHWLIKTYINNTCWTRCRNSMFSHKIISLGDSMGLFINFDIWFFLGLVRLPLRRAQAWPR